MKNKLMMLACGVMTMSAAAAAKETITIATVNNGDMITMKELSNDFTRQNPDIALKWVTLEENILRQRVTTDVATGGGQYDVMTIGTYEVPIWGKQGWLTELDNLGASYDVDDLLPAIRSGLTVDEKLFAAPFYGESSMVMYRTDLIAKAGLEMPKKPSWGFIRQAAKAMTDKEAGVYGICLRGKAGWGENMALITAMSNSFGARWFDENWQPQFDTQEWHDTLQYYVDVMAESGPPGASANGFNENLALFQTGKCGMWIDATVAGAFVTNEKDSAVADKVGFALAPDKGLGKRGNWLWAWTLAIPASSEKSAAAQKFISWATSKDYSALVAKNKGWAKVPPGTRASLYNNPEYMKAAPFAQITIDSIQSADPVNPTVKPVPYVGVQFVAIPEFQGIGTAVGQQFAAALTGTMTVKEALKASQRLVDRTMRKAGYPK
ncbi:sugar ABC transporter substrate-binding protein [Colwellia sp. MB02u-19]|uniref:ABC transporter substrate-binding protein n=1 Tax=unclassified Colwellia TaxID=196834 RepID=UPI0015F4BA2A|nr:MULTISPECIES: sugar ABC transporter substrate-binding protein [unclassified Colwellia]MBA6225384.1 sugar ABC transporter substrate-binding protein [Colwellia sp. MB3u-45]MBA6266602.1 sugar ABC transporter substrate-binding protein [Colwellia sp. MB3u-43]MBA6320426.1 sugar ABC transporter substrate-binding protein [Colwellia sp. MB02u-19]